MQTNTYNARAIALPYDHNKCLKKPIFFSVLRTRLQQRYMEFGNTTCFNKNRKRQLNWTYRLEYFLERLTQSRV